MRREVPDGWENNDDDCNDIPKEFVDDGKQGECKRELKVHLSKKLFSFQEQEKQMKNPYMNIQPEGRYQKFGVQILDDEMFIDIQLFVGQIPKNWDQNAVKDFFSKYGDIIEAQIIRDPQRNHKGCAFVKFQSLTQAQSAIEQLKNQHIEGMTTAIQIRWADGEWQRLGVPQNCEPRLFIGSLPKECVKEWLMEPFGQFGEYSELSIMTDQDGISKGSGFIKYKHLQHAILAIRKLNAQLTFEGFSEHPIEVRFAQQQKPKPKPNPYPNPDGRVNNPQILDSKTPQFTGLYRLFKTPHPENRPYFYNYQTQETQFEEPPPRATVYTSDTEYYFQPARETPAVTKQPSAAPYIPGPAGANLFIFHVPQISDQRLREIFSKHGEVLSARVMRKPDGQSKGFGFVSYQQPNDANVAIQKLNGFNEGGQRLKISHKKGDDMSMPGLNNSYDPLG